MSIVLAARVNLRLVQTKGSAQPGYSRRLTTNKENFAFSFEMETNYQVSVTFSCKSMYWFPVVCSFVRWEGVPRNRAVAPPLFSFQIFPRVSNRARYPVHDLLTNSNEEGMRNKLGTDFSFTRVPQVAARGRQAPSLSYSRSLPKASVGNLHESDCILFNTIPVIRRDEPPFHPLRKQFGVKSTKPVPEVTTTPCTVCIIFLVPSPGKIMSYTAPI